MGWTLFQASRVRGSLGGLALGACVLAMSSPAQAQLVFSFENGLTGDGFTLFQQSGSRHTWIATDMVIDINDGFNLLSATHGANRVIPTPWADRDNFGQNVEGIDDWTILLRSPTFELTGGGPLQMDLMGGTQPRVDLSGPIPQHVGQLGERQSTHLVAGIGDPHSYLMGFALRDALTGEYVLVGHNEVDPFAGDEGNDGKYRPGTDKEFRGSWNTVSFNEASLAPYVNNGRKYQVDIFESYGNSSWGWMGFDNLRVPGTLAAPFLPGDTNDDGVVDGSDVIPIFANFTSTPTSTPFGKLNGLARIDGDFDGNGDVDANDVVELFASYGNSINDIQGFAVISSHTDRAQLVYDPANGTLTIDPTTTPDGIVTTFQLRSESHAFNAPGVLILPAASFLQGDTTDRLFWADSTFVGFDDIHNLGAVLPTGLTLEQFESAISSAVYVGVVGGGEFDFELVYVPEPASLALLGAGTLLLVRRRRAA